MKRYILIFCVLILSAISVFIFESFKFNDGKLHIVFCNVGQGDSIFIRSPKGADILIDSGPDQSVLDCLSSHMPFWDRDIELAFLTHPHEDHMKGYEYIFARYQIKNFNTEAVSNNTSTYKSIQNLIAENKIEERFLVSGDLFSLSGLQIKTLGPSKEFLNKTSPQGKITESEGFGNLIEEISYGNFKALLTGDSQVSGFLDTKIPDKINILQIPHHGSKYGIDKEILQNLKPQLAIISVGKNKYGHPAPIILKTLSDLKINFLRTDKKGDIEIIVDKNGNYKII